MTDAEEINGVRLDLADNEAVCPKCNLAFLITDRRLPTLCPDDREELAPVA